MLTGLEDGAAAVSRATREWLRRFGPASLNADAEVAVWLGLPDNGRERVLTRLEALLRHRTAKRPGGVEGVARELGVGNSNVYRLMRRMDEVGPVSGLATHKRVATSASAARDGFGLPWEKWIAIELVARPGITVPAMSRALKERALKDGTEGPPPEISALRRRMNHIRPQVVAAASRYDGVGFDLTVLGVGISAAVSGAGGSVDPLGLVVAIDNSTNLIVGQAVMADDLTEALLRLVRSVGVTLPELARAGVAMAEVLGLTWWAPKDYAGGSDWFGAAVPAERRSGVRMHRTSARNQGLMVVRSLGDRIGAIRLHAARSRRRDASEGTVDDPVVTYPSVEDADYAVGYETRRWNERRIADLDPLPKRARRSALRRARLLAEEFGLAFLPVVEGWTSSSSDRRITAEDGSAA